MSNKKHLKLNERVAIEQMLKDKKSFAHIARSLSKSPSTISKEVRSHMVFRRTGTKRRKYNSCKFRFTCTRSSLCTPCHSERKYSLCRNCSMCNRFCNDYVQDLCTRLLSPPYVCNGCGKITFCTLEKRFYYADSAHTEYRTVLSESRSGIALSEDELTALDSLISPLLKKNQSPHHIYVNNADSLCVSERSIYRLIDAHALSATNLDLPRKVRFKARKKARTVKIDKKCRIGRDFNCYTSFMENNPDTPVVQLDSVIGKKGGKTLLTIHFVKAEFMLAFLRERNDSQSVIDIFNMIYERLGSNDFRRLFPVCLTDNGTEFSNPLKLEFDDTLSRRTRIFYCDPSAPFQKGSMERNHEFIRLFFPKGRSNFENVSQEQISLMMDHINSYSRESLADRSPYEVFAFLYGEQILELLNCHKVSPNEITLNKTIFRNEVESC